MLIEILRTKFSDRLLTTHAYRGQETVSLRREGLLDIARFLRDDEAMAFDFLMDLSCVDYLKFGRSQISAPLMATPAPLPYYMTPKRSGEAWQRGVSNDDFRFEMVYHLYSSTKQHRLRLKVPVTTAEPVVDSLTELWASANWYEREVWDMFGIRFTGHPNLTRILMYEEFKGHPLRKDYPVRRRQPLIGPVN